MRLTRRNRRPHQPGEPATARPPGLSPGLAYLMIMSGCWMGGRNFAPLFRTDWQTPPESEAERLR
jgi:hypothetical protein